MITDKHEIKWLVYNWFWSPADNDQGYERVIVGKNGVTKIEEHEAMGNGDRWYYDVHHEDGRITRTFNPNEVGYELKGE